MRKDTIQCWFGCLALTQPFTVSVAFGKAQCWFVTVMQGRAQPNMRMKLSARGRRLKRKAKSWLFS
jgi:hypothetical protein